MSTCPTCGGLVEIVSSDEGTSFYRPVPERRRGYDEGAHRRRIEDPLAPARSGVASRYDSIAGAFISEIVDICKRAEGFEDGMLCDWTLEGIDEVRVRLAGALSDPSVPQEAESDG